MLAFQARLRRYELCRFVFYVCKSMVLKAYDFDTKFCRMSNCGVLAFCAQGGGRVLANVRFFKQQYAEPAKQGG